MRTAEARYADRNEKRESVTIIGAGLAGLSAAVRLAELHISCNLISAQVSERAQSVLAEGGINAALDVMGENDTTAEHFDDTMAGGVQLADPEAVRGLTEKAPEIVRHLSELGVPFSMDGERLIQRPFGGQKKKRTAFCKSSTGKALMTAMIDEARRFECDLQEDDESLRESRDGLPGDGGNLRESQDSDNREDMYAGGRAEGRITRYPHHVLEDLIVEEGRCEGAVVRDSYTGEVLYFPAPVILAFGGPHGLLPGQTTGTTTNDGNGLAIAFFHGAEAANLEFIQYHPTTVQIPGKRLLISEAARGEGGRLFVERTGRDAGRISAGKTDGKTERWYFMEEKYPELGNLMPRDVVSREMARVLTDPDCGEQIYLDLTGLSGEIWKKKLPDLREEIRHYLGVDPAEVPVPVSPGIHYFMGGLYVDREHRTSIRGLYAAGECACQYHGANRLGGNSLLGALYGGRVAAETAARELEHIDSAEDTGTEIWKETTTLSDGSGKTMPVGGTGVTPQISDQIMQILMRAMGITRRKEELLSALAELEELREVCGGQHGSECLPGTDGQTGNRTMDQKRLLLAEAMLRSALARKESRGAHQREDFPERNDADYQKTTVAQVRDGSVTITFREIPMAKNKEK